MARSYEGATVTPYGSYVFHPGLDYSIDTKLSLIQPLLAELHRKLNLVEVIEDPSRDWVMMSFRPQEEVEVGQDVGVKLGTVQRVPNDMTLIDVKKDLYGEDMLEQRGFLEWLATNHPAVMQDLISTGEAVKEVASFAADGLIKMGVGLFLAWLAFKAFTSKGQ
jgi:hypothetical protein